MRYEFSHLRANAQRGKINILTSFTVTVNCVIEVKGHLRHPSQGQKVTYVIPGIVKWYLRHPAEAPSLHSSGGTEENRESLKLNSQTLCLKPGHSE
jgi:hypothetical protein